MRRPRRARLLVAALIAGLAALAAVAGAAVPRAVLDGAWVSARSRHFLVLSDLGEKDAVEVARKLERLAEALASTNPALEAASPMPTVVFAFSGPLAFEPYQRIGAENVAGYFIATDDENRIAFDASRSHGDSDVLYHEFIHGYLRHNFASMPAWLNEGLAMYYSSFAPGDASADIGLPLRDPITWLRGDHALFSADELFSVTRDSPDYRFGDRRLTFYAESWALVHYLIHASPENHQRFETLLAALRAGQSPAAAHAKFLPPAQWKTLIDGVRSYVARPRLEAVTYRFTKPFDVAEVKVEALPRAERLFRLAGLLIAIGATPAAEEHLRAAIAADAAHGASIAMLGLICDLRGETVRAESLYAAANDAAPNDATVYALAGRGAFRRYLAKRDSLHSVPPELGAARTRFARCLEIDPDRVDALIAYGKISSYESPAPPAGIGALRVASRLEPARLELRTDLLYMLGRSSRCDEADSVYRTLEPCGRREILRVAVSSLIGCRVARAQRLIQAGDSQDAAGLFDLDSVVHDPELRAYAAAELARLKPAVLDVPTLAPHVEHAAEMPDFSETMRTFNAGLRLATRGRYSEALVQLEAARRRFGPGDLQRDADLAIARVRGRLRIREGIDALNAGNPGAASGVFQSMLATPLDDTTRAYVQRLLKRADARVALDSGVRMARHGQASAASARFDSMAAAGIDDDLRAYARSLGSQLDTRAEVQKGIAWLKAGRLDEALAHFEKLENDPASEGMHLYIRNLIAHTKARIEVARAIERIRAGRHEEARAILAGVLQRPIGQHLRDYVQGLVDQMGAPAQAR